MSDLSALFDLPISPDSGAAKTAWPLRWGAPTAAERGPLITSRDPTLRNTIGAHGGGYGVYRALAIAARTLPSNHRPDLAPPAPAPAPRPPPPTPPPHLPAPAPADLLGPNPQWADADKIVSLDPWGH